MNGSRASVRCAGQEVEKKKKNLQTLSISSQHLRADHLRGQRITRLSALFVDPISNVKVS